MKAGGTGRLGRVQVRVVTLRYDPVLEAFDDSSLQELGREVFTIRDHFFVRNGVPYLAVVVTCGLKPAVEEAKPLEKGRGRQESWRTGVGGGSAAIQHPA